MTERPILFSTPMVRAVLAGAKTQTRRLIKGARGTFSATKVPYCIGDKLWVRETFSPCYFDDKCVYRSDWTGSCSEPKWKPSIFMHRAESRITLEVTDVRVERLHGISYADAISEGARGMLATKAKWPASCAKWSMSYPHPVETDREHGDMHCLGSPQMAFANMWEKINGKHPGCSWDANPWVWAVSFRRVRA